MVQVNIKIYIAVLKKKAPIIRATSTGSHHFSITVDLHSYGHKSDLEEIDGNCNGESSKSLSSTR